MKKNTLYIIAYALTVSALSVTNLVADNWNTIGETEGASATALAACTTANTTCLAACTSTNTNTCLAACPKTNNTACQAACQTAACQAACQTTYTACKTAASPTK